MVTRAILASLVTTTAVCSSFNDWGSSGGSGPKGGIGDKAHPVLHAQSFITDGYVSVKPNTTRQLAIGPPPVLLSGPAQCNTSRRRIVVDSTLAGAQQEMLGFGHSWTDSTVEVFNRLEPQLLDQLMEELFGQTGNNMGFMRHTIGSSDLSGEQYSYDDNGPSFNEPTQPDYYLANFSLGDAGTRMVEMLAKMGQYKGDVFLYGAPWSYPGWMKTNGLFIAPNLGGNHFLLNNSLGASNYYRLAAEYLLKYIDSFQQHGVVVNGLSLQNEPLNYQGGYPTMYLDAVDAVALLYRGIGVGLQERGVRYLAYDHNTDQPAYPARVIQGAPDYVDAVAWHCYQGPVADYTVLQDFRDNFPHIKQFMTECSNTGLIPGTLNFWVANNFLSAVRYGASGGSFWVLATDPMYGPHSPYGGCTTCSGSIFVNSSTVYEKTIDYYMIGHFSRFIRRGAVNHKILQGLEGRGNDWNSQFFGIAIKNPDGSWAMVFLNSFPHDQDLDLEFTDSGFIWQGTIPKESVVTWLLPADGRLVSIGTQGFASPTVGRHAGRPAHGRPSHPYQRGMPTLAQDGCAFSRSSSSGVPVQRIPDSTTTTSRIVWSCPTTTSTSEGLPPVPDTDHTIAAELF